jgi:cob(I)alamin adenosyltransferase
MPIYTRSGDKGETSLFTGQKVLKNDPFIEALGTVDECNSAIGLSLSFLPHEPIFSELREELIIIQHALFDVGAALATPRTRSEKEKIEKTRFDQEETKLLEDCIDRMTNHLPKLKNFILPGGHPSGSSLHLARSICRRLERIVTPLYKEKDVSDNVIAYLNRLSDYLFTASRFINHLTHSPETLWQHNLLKEAK